MNEKIKRYDMVNILRLVCAFFVIAIHTSALYSFGQVPYGLVSFILARIAVPFFFLTSGYFFYKKIKIKGYFKKYIFKLMKIYLITTGVYSVFLSTYLITKNNTLILLLKSIFVNGISPALWYFPALIFSTIFVYIFLKNDKFNLLIPISIVLLLIGLMGDTYYGIIYTTPLVNVVDGYNFIFDMTRNGLCIGVPFITLGAMIYRYNLNEKIKHVNLEILFASILFLGEGYFIIYKTKPLDYNIYISLAILVPLIFIWALNSKIVIKESTSYYCREMSLWIYCFHELFQVLLSYFNLMTSNTLINYIMVLLPSIVVAYIISRVKSKK